MFSFLRIIDHFQPRTLTILLLAIGFLTYLNTLPNQFLWDDEEQIVANPTIRHVSNLPQLFLTSTGTAGGADAHNGFYRPLMFIAYLINYQFWGLKAWGFHLFQILVHLINLVLFFLILRHLLNHQKIKYHQALPFLISLLFAVHPANVEAVVYLGAMGEILAAFFVLTSFGILLKGINYEGRNIQTKYLLGSLLLGLLGLFAKETAGVFFLLAIGYLLIFVKPKLGTWLNYLFSFVATIGFYLFVRLGLAQVNFSQPHVVPIAQAPLSQRLLTIPNELITYLGLMVFPIKLQIYRHFVVTAITDVRFWGATLILLILTGLILLVIKKQLHSWQRLAFFLLGWFFVGLLPALNLIPLNMTLAERWLYLPLMGGLSLLGILLLPWWEKRSRFSYWLGSSIFAVIILLLFIRTFIRIGNWRNGLILYGHDLKYDPGNANLENNYGVELFRIGKTAQAFPHFQSSVKIENKWAISHNNLGAAYEQQGNWEEAKNEYEKATALSDYYLAYQNLANILLKLDRVEEAKKFLEVQALPRFSTNPSLYTTLALIYYQQNDSQKALILTQKALSFDPSNPQTQRLYQFITNPTPSSKK